ncbi:MAG: hypothetical protein IT376_17975 [Polyangiaceae bacterium]|nr:hypothetical protein [Polyangiaceae bacterium]
MVVSKLGWAAGVLAAGSAVVGACGGSEGDAERGAPARVERSALVDTELGRVDARFGARIGARSGESPARVLARRGASLVAARGSGALGVEIADEAAGGVRVEDPSGAVSVAFALDGAARGVRADVSGARAAWFGGAGGGGDVFVRVGAAEVEDYVRLAVAPAAPRLTYRLDVTRVAGLRLVGGGLELLDARGAPRLRVAPPWVADARGVRHAATLELDGCAADRAASAPWGRPVTPPGAPACTLHLTWPAGLAAPLLVDPSWQATANTMAVQRATHASVALDDGKVLVAGGCGTGCTTAELYDPVTRTFALTGVTQYPHPSTSHGVRLASGKALLTGGDGGSFSQPVAELYSPTSGTFAFAGNHSVAGEVLVALPNGRALLVLGGSGGAAAEFDPALGGGVGGFATLAATLQDGEGVAAVALADGRVAITGGLHTFYVTTTGTWVYARQQTTSIYDPTTQQFSAGPSLSTGRYRHAMARLSDGRVVVAGGNVGGSSDQVGTSSASAEIWTPPAGSWSSAGTLAAARESVTAISLPARALFVGGTPTHFGAPSSYVDAFVTASSTLVAAPSLLTARARPGVALAGGTALVTAGGSGAAAQSAEVYLSTQGEACAVGGECASGYCVDAVCCDTQCAGACVACTAALKGAGADGGCGPIAAGADPASECADQGVASCGTDGACDGAGQCRRYAAGTECAAATCTGTTRTLASTCGGAGACTAGSTVSCAPYACGSGGACRTTCTQASHCASTSYCGGGACIPKKALGGGCGSAGECLSGLCVDDVCCDRACDGTCEACRDDLKQSLAGSGSCDAARVGTDPHDTCAPEAACGNDGTCDGAGACRKAVLGTACGATACIDATTVAGQICNGAGQCISDSTGTSCGAHLCASGACALPCVDDTDCVATAYCAAPDCVPRAAAGEPCATNAGCQSGFCSRDQVCCDAACQGACEACTAASKGSGLSGTCGPVAAATDPFEDCGDTGAASCDTNGACDGAGACARYADGFACEPAACVGGAARSYGCASGSCVATDTPCGANGCAGGACLSGCTTDADCSTGAYCDAGGCAPKAATGVACAEARTCASGFCVDGVCCTSACSGQCEACDVATAPGTCSPVNGAPHGARVACSAAGSGEDACAARTCEGSKSTAVCSGYVGPEVECRSQSCAGGVETFREPCDGTGQCPVSRTRKCFPYACGGASCLTTCTQDTDCAAGARCDTDEGQCATALTCDGSVLTSPDGESKDCAPYVCDEVEGCLVACTTTEQCTSGNVCDPSTGRCVAGAAPAAADDGGCGCRHATPPAGRPAWLALLVALGVTLAARRGGRRVTRSASG